MTPRMEKRVAHNAQTGRTLARLEAARPRQHDNGGAAASRSDQQCRERNAGNTPASGNEGVGEHVRTRFQIGPKAVCGIADPYLGSRTERRKLVSSAGPDFDERARES